MKLFRNPSKEVRKLSLVKIITGIDRKFNWPIIIYTDTLKYIENKSQECVRQQIHLSRQFFR